MNRSDVILSAYLVSFTRLRVNVCLHTWFVLRMMTMFSVLDMYKIGVGPSSSHTVGPMVAAQRFSQTLVNEGVVGRVSRVRVTLYGSLSLTGLGHGTDRAVLAGLEGNLPDTVDTDHLLDICHECERSGVLLLAGGHSIAFDYARDVVFEQWKKMAAHPNGMRFEAFDDAGATVAEQVWYSVGGGFVRQGHADDPMIGLHQQAPEGSALADSDSDDEDYSSQTPYPFGTGRELIDICDREGKSIAQVAMANETVMRSEEETKAELLKVAQAMHTCVIEGCTSVQTTLPGGLDVPRRAPGIYRRLANSGDVLQHGSSAADLSVSDSTGAWVDLFAMAVNEQNAGGGRIVTAPTNGSAGIIPAVLEYYRNFVSGADEEGVVRFLLTAGAVGYLFKRNASISGAEVGCQGEVGSACSMAAAGLCAVLGGTPAQVENAAEIGMEHNLGLTCDPVGGLVQIPCIERNAIASNTAINAVRVSLLGDGSHMVTLDQVIATMKQTGADMSSAYKETSKGGLAVNVVEC
jgi:L-serine dehydratase